MITGSALEKTARLRLAHRAFHEADGSVRVLIGRDEAVRLSQADWRDVQADYAAALAPADRGLRWGFMLTLPMILATLSVVSVFRLSPRIDAAGPLVSGAATVAMIIWWPLLMLALHARAVHRATRVLDDRLATCPRAPRPAGRPRALQTIEIVALLLFGPPVLFDLLGTLWPHAFDGTPFMGRQLGLFSGLGLAAFIILAGARLLRHGQGRSATE